MATTAESTSGEVMRSERIAGSILPRVLNSFDMVAIFVAIVLYISNAPGIASAGPVSYIYMTLGLLTFLIPGAIVTGQLGLMFPGEGSIYVWTTKAFGAFMGCFGGFCAWWPGVLVVFTNGIIVVAFIQQLGSLFKVNLLTDPWQQGLVIIAVIAISFAVSILRFRLTQNVVNIIFLSYGGAILLIGIAGALWLLTGHASTTDLSFKAANWWPQSSNYTVFGFVILALLGIEVPLNMGVEITNVRAITRYLLWGSVVVMVAYLLGIFGVMVAVPVKDQPLLTSVVEAIQIGFGPVGRVLAVIVNVVLIGFFIFGTAVYNYSFGRLLFVSGLDRRLPAVMSKVNANRVPWVAVLVQSIIAAAFALVIFILAPLVIKTAAPADLANLMYYIILAALTVIWAISMVILFIDVIIIRHRYHEAFTRIRLAPDWVFYLCAVLGLLSSAVSFWVIFTAPWVPTLINTFNWDAWIIGLSVISLVAGAVVYFIGQTTIRKDVTDDEIIAQATGGAAGE